MSKTLIVTANASIAKFFSTSLNGSIEIIGELAHPESRMKGKDLQSDGSGDFHPREVTIGVHNAHSDPKEDEWHKFAKQVAERIAYYSQSYLNIVISASPHFEGLINGNLDKHTEQKIIKRINKDYTNLNNQELLATIKDKLTTSIS